MLRTPPAGPLAAGRAGLQIKSSFYLPTCHTAREKWERRRVVRVYDFGHRHRLPAGFHRWRKNNKSENRNPKQARDSIFQIQKGGAKYDPAVQPVNLEF
jgi:hypothetical protein